MFSVRTKPKLCVEVLYPTPAPPYPTPPHSFGSVFPLCIRRDFREHCRIVVVVVCVIFSALALDVHAWESNKTPPHQVLRFRYANCSTTQTRPPSSSSSGRLDANAPRTARAQSNTYQPHACTTHEWRRRGVIVAILLLLPPGLSVVPLPRYTDPQTNNQPTQPTGRYGMMSRLMHAAHHHTIMG